MLLRSFLHSLRFMTLQMGVKAFQVVSRVSGIPWNAPEISRNALERPRHPLRHSWNISEYKSLIQKSFKTDLNLLKPHEIHWNTPLQCLWNPLEHPWNPLEHTLNASEACGISLKWPRHPLKPYGTFMEPLGTPLRTPWNTPEIPRKLLKPPKILWNVP